MIDFISSNTSIDSEVDGGRLHAFAEHYFKEAYDKAKEFYIQYKVLVNCDKENCIFRSYRCFERQFSLVNLKDYYDTCLLEKKIKGNDGNTYVADILLKNSQRDIPPLLIEIWCSHECPSWKKQSGLQIIELKVLCKDDIINICDQKKIMESKKRRFYFFKRKACGRINPDKRIFRYVHIIGTRPRLLYYPCDECNNPYDKYSDLELNVVCNDRKEEIFMSGYVNQHYAIEPWKGDYEHYVRINEKEIKLFPVKNSPQCRPDDYKVVVYGPHRYNNSDFVIEQVDKHLQPFLFKKNIQLCGGYSKTRKTPFTDCFFKLANGMYSIILQHEEWESEGKSAGYKCIPRLLSGVNEVIVFDDGKDKLTQYVIKMSEERKLPLHVVNI